MAAGVFICIGTFLKERRRLKPGLGFSHYTPRGGVGIITIHLQ